MSDRVGEGAANALAANAMAANAPLLSLRLQQYLSVVQGCTQVYLLSFNQWELSVELRPRPPSEETAEELEPLRLRVSWGHRDTFSLQVVAKHR